MTRLTGPSPAGGSWTQGPVVCLSCVGWACGADPELALAIAPTAKGEELVVLVAGAVYQGCVIPIGLAPEDRRSRPLDAGPPPPGLVFLHVP